jgi:hypothetical protein
MASNKPRLNVSSQLSALSGEKNTETNRRKGLSGKQSIIGYIFIAEG